MKKLMKNLNFEVIAAIVIITILLSTCRHGYNEMSRETKNREIEAEQVWGGKHELRKLNIKESISQKSNGYFFVIIGEYNSETKKEQKIRFYFNNYQNEWEFKEMNFDNVNIKTDNSVTTPYIVFHLDAITDCNCHGQNPSHATIYCKESDFNPDIKINDLK